MKTNKTFADLAKQIQNKYAKKTDSISKRSMERELNNLMQLNEEARQEEEMLSQNSQEQFRYGGRLPRYYKGGNIKFNPNVDIKPGGIDEYLEEPKFKFNPNVDIKLGGNDEILLDPAFKFNPKTDISLGGIDEQLPSMYKFDPKTDIVTGGIDEYLPRDPNESSLSPRYTQDKNSKIKTFFSKFNTTPNKKGKTSEDTADKDNFMTPGNYLGLGTAGIATIGDFALAAKNKPRYVKNYFRGVMNPAIAETRRSLGDADRAMTAEGRLSLNKVLNDVSNNSGSNASRIANMSSILSNYNNQSGINRAKLRSEFTGKIGQLLASQGQLEGQGEFMRQEINTQEEDAQRQSYADALRNMETRGYNSAQLLNKNTENTQKYSLVKEYFPDFTVEKDGDNLDLFYIKAAELKRKEAELAKKQKQKK